MTEKVQMMVSKLVDLINQEGWDVGEVAWHELQRTHNPSLDEIIMARDLICDQVTDIRQSERLKLRQDRDLSATEDVTRQGQYAAETVKRGGSPLVASTWLSAFIEGLVGLGYLKDRTSPVNSDIHFWLDRDPILVKAGQCF